MPVSERVVIHLTCFIGHHELLSVWTKSDKVGQVPAVRVTQEQRKTLDEQRKQIIPMISDKRDDDDDNAMSGNGVSWERLIYGEDSRKVSPRSLTICTRTACINMAGIWGSLGSDQHLGGPEGGVGDCI